MFSNTTQPRKMSWCKINTCRHVVLLSCIMQGKDERFNMKTVKILRNNLVSYI